MPHTPGPWEVRDKFYVGRPGRMSLATLCAGDVEAADVETHEANGRLIAAAPDLLAACKTALAYVRVSYLEDGEQLEMIEQLEAAIAKAETT